LEVTTEAIRQLRDKTGAGIMNCKRALENAEGDQDKAEDILREKGILTASKKAGRDTLQGLVEAYVHNGNRIGVLLELNCETDFVAHTPEFRDLAHNLSMQIAAMTPLYIDKADINPEDPSNPEKVCLLQQPYIKDPSQLVLDLVNDVVSRVGENIRVKRFTRFALGE
jgi:elongation factor Ts